MSASLAFDLNVKVKISTVDRVTMFVFQSLELVFIFHLLAFGVWRLEFKVQLLSSGFGFQLSVFKVQFLTFSYRLSEFDIQLLDIGLSDK